MATCKTVICYCCGSNITAQANNRYNLFSKSFSDLLSIWRELFEELPVDETSDDILYNYSDEIVSGRICRPCAASLQKIGKLKSMKKDMKEEMKNAFSVIKSYKQGGMISETEVENQLTSTPTTCSSQSSLPMKRTLEKTNSPRKKARDSETISPKVLLQVEREKTVHRYHLPSQLKKIETSLARGSFQSFARHCLSNEQVYRRIQEAIGRKIRTEIKLTSTKKSILYSTSAEDLRSFKWKEIYKELKEKAPTLLFFLEAATKTQTPRPNHIAVICVCASIILKHRFPHMCLVQKIVGLILYSSHCSKDAFERLCSIELSVAYTTVNRTVNFISKDHDVEVKKWRDDIVSVLLKEDHALSAADNGILFELDNEDSLSSISLSSSDSSVDDECEDCNSDTSCDPVPLSPVTSSASDDDNTSSTEQLQVSLSDVRQEVFTEKDNEQCVTDSEPLCTSFKIVGDNVDKNVTPRYMRSDRRTKSLHYYHSFAVKSRINVDDLPSQKPDSCLPSPTSIAKSLLPSVNDDDCLIANLKILFSRILLQTLPTFEFNFSDLVCRHIIHRRYKEMSSKSTVVPLGVLPKNENKTKEMKEILEHLHQYVPKVVSTRQYQVPGSDNSKEVTVIDERVHHILLGGDQLSQARARGALKSKANSQTPSTKLNGFIPTVEDWHTKLTLFEVIWKYFVRKESSGDHGTAYQLRNVLGRCNVVTSPKKDLNACEDFLMLIIRSYVTLAAMEILGMKEVDDIPSSLPSEFWLEDMKKRKDAMDSIVTSIADNYINLRYNQTPTVSNDNISSYAKQLFSVACLYLEFADSVREGDGERVLRCWRYLSVLFHNSNRKNYAMEGVLLLYQHQYLLPPKEAERLIYSRFVNTSGYPGRNISLDLHMEHLNRVLKQGVAQLGPNKTENAFIRLGKAIGSLSPILENFDKENEITQHHSRHEAPCDTKEVHEVVKHLQKCEVFADISGRNYSYFNKQFTSLLHKNKECDLIEWMTGHLHKN